jgi:pre-peptidase
MMTMKDGPLRFLLLVSLVMPAFVGTVTPSHGQDKKADKKAEPRVLLALPLGVQPGSTTKVTIRGVVLDAATEVRFPGSKVTAKIVAKGKANVPDKMPPTRVGDTQVVAEVTVPAGVAGPFLDFVVVTPAGETKTHQLLLETAIPVIVEKEPNEGFRQAQKIQLPQAIDGVIDRPRDVDVFAFEGKAGQRIVFEVHAARLGSLLDPILTLYAADASQVASSAADVKADPRIELTLPGDGTYFLSLNDAHDQGGPLHVYRLTGRTVK